MTWFLIGKFTKILYDQDNRIASAKTFHFLLEKSRVIQQEAHERNYHIFYRMCAGLNPEERESFKIRSYENFKILSGGKPSRELPEDQDLGQVRSALVALDFAETDIANIFSVLSLILHLGNLRFNEADYEGNSNQSEASSNGFVSIDDTDTSMAFIATLLRCDERVVRERLSTRTTTSGRGSMFRIPLDKNQANDARNALCKALYGQLFRWVIDKLNASYDIRDDVSETAASIGILDIFGFEILENNGFEQLCINYANEALQQQFNHHVFTLEQDNYVAEGIDWTMIQFMDNQPILDVITRKPRGIFPTLEEQCLLARKISPDGRTDNGTQLLGLLHKHHMSSEHYAKPRIASSMFEIKHFAGTVSYNASQFIAKNNDSLHTDLLMLVQMSENPFISSLFQANESDPSSVTSGHGLLVGSSTVSSLFREQLQSLMTTLWSTRPHYVRCIKPNEEKKKYKFDSLMVLNQLRYSGVMEVVRIRRQGYPVRRYFDEFVEKYEILTRTIAANNVESINVEDQCAQICRTLFGENTHQMGRKQIYLRDNQVQQLDGAVRKILYGAVVRIQTICRQFLARQELETRKTRWMNRRIRSATLIQAFIRRVREQREYQRIRTATVLVQSFMRKCIIIARYQGVQQSIKRVQIAVRGYLSRRRLELNMEELKNATISGDIQSVRGILLRFPHLRTIRYRHDHFKTIAHFAASSTSIGVVTLLFDDKSLFQKDSLGNTPLHIASHSANVAMLRHLAVLLHDTKSTSTKSTQQLLSMTTGEQKPKPGWLKLWGGVRKTGTKANSCPSGQREGWLWKRRLTSHWRKRYVVINEHELRYCKSKNAKTSSKMVKVSLESVMVKKSTKFAASIEIYSPELLSARNKEGCLYFAASNEIEAQSWLSYMRHVINTSIDHTLRRKPIKILDTKALKEFLSSKNNAGQSALHVLCSRPHESSSTSTEIRVAMWLMAFGADVNAETLECSTPLSICIQSGKTKLSALLLSRGAQLSRKEEKTELNLASVQVLKCMSDRSGISHAPAPVSVSSGIKSTGCTYLSLYIEGYRCSEGGSDTAATDTVLKVQVLDNNQSELEPASEFDTHHAYSHRSELLMGFLWHMNTPLETLSSAAHIVLELKDSKGVSMGRCQMKIDERDIDTSLFDLTMEVGTSSISKKGKKSSFKVFGERYLHRA